MSSHMHPHRILSWQGPVIAAHLGCISTLGRDDDQALQGRISGRCTDGPITYQEREENEIY